MGAQNRSIGIDGDYGLASGSPIDVGLSRVPDVLLRIQTVKGTMPIAPDFGNAARSIGKVLANGEPAVENMFTASVQDLIDRREVWAWSVKATADGSSYYVEIKFRDASGSHSHNCST